MDIALLLIVNCKSDIKIDKTRVITWLSYLIYSDT